MPRRPLTMHQTITQSPEWRAWRAQNAPVLSQYQEDINDAEETGFFAPKHWKAFLSFLYQIQKERQPKKDLKINRYNKNDPA